TATDTIEGRRRDRMPEIQRFKNSRLVGENHYGLLTIREQPSGPYGERVRQVVGEENDDRRALMKTLAAEHRVAVSRIEADQAAMGPERGFPGEWTEQRRADGTGQRVQKRTGEPAPAEPALPPVR